MPSLLHVNGLKQYKFTIIITIVTFFIFMIGHQRNFDLLVKAAYGVIEGKPHWIAYQNRILGPYIVLAMSKLGLTYSTALKTYFFTTFLIENLLLQSIAKTTLKLEERRVRIFMLRYCVLFLIFQDYWYYPWDSMDIIFFTLFANMILTQSRDVWIVLLFFIALLNRESALFIAFYFIIRGINLNNAPKITISSINDVTIGLGLIVLGIAETKIVRTLLFQSKPDGTPDLQHEMLGNFIVLKENLTLNLTLNKGWFFIAITLGLLSLIYRKFNQNQKELFMIYVVIILSIITFAMIKESRVYLMLIPMFILLFLYSAQHEKKQQPHNR
ncbi:hypothetical protein Lste_1151 [Legionella steelei]|uniref:Uncharacterized protein n=1 Tax=Legionella steelei TaxID=947033 RepID=A0A0W0ZG14_9GAMM|nr:hypothetical protein [Legionella steelei]KTD67993.1 hypothetical protein Lste_1151 [Legionella steelei]